MKPIIITGAYGVGKSEFATQWALQHAPCVLADFDIINPYFRPREETDWLATEGVTIVGSMLKHHTNQDFPAFSGDISGVIAKGLPLIIDCAGSENGLKPLATFRDVLKDAQVWLVVNANRPESFFDQIEPMIDLFQSRGALTITGLVHNTHLLDQTDPPMILHAQAALEKEAQRLGLPIVMTMVDAHLGLDSKQFANPVLTFDRLILRSDWMKGNTL
jgi:hypothetical protein